MMENKLENIVDAIEALSDVIQTEHIGNNGQTIADSLEGIEYWLRCISETLERMESKMK